MTTRALISAKPKQTGIEKIEFECPHCGKFKTIFGGFTPGMRVKYECGRCGEDISIEIKN
jgi:uncharacterized protein (DUF983 family)